MWRIFLFFPLLILHAEISALYLSWYEDPATSMTIQWHTPLEEFGDAISLLTKDDNWIDIEGEHTSLEQTLIHKVSLKNLNPGAEYAFRIGNSKIYRFRTAPDNLNEPLRFVIGGDVYANTKLFRRMSQTVMENNPHFAVLGGDIAYAFKIHPFRSSILRRWKAFLKDWMESMITADGRILPFLIVPGNHDISPDNYNVFFSLFAFPQKQLYRSLEFGSYLTLFLLDTGHFQPIEGRQTVWLEKALSASAQVPYRFAVYHEAAYPSHYPYQGIIPKKIRTHWAPLFDKYELLAAFENHNHAYKRTHPVKANQIDPAGVIYIGDGGWGAAPRSTNDLWYLAEKRRKSSVIIVELTTKKAEIKAIDLFNNQIDLINLSLD
jgi:hypothetical protein